MPLTLFGEGTGLYCIFVLTKISIQAKTLRTALPEKARQETQASIQSSSSESSSRTEPSLLHRLLASGIIQLFLFIQLILPHVRYLLYGAYRYEREHRLLEKVLSSSIDTVEQVGKRSFSIGGTLLKAGNGRLGGVVLESAAWWIEGISGGIHEGFGEGIGILGGEEGRAGRGDDDFEGIFGRFCHLGRLEQ